ncbi:unnamed protein product [Fraxinus pennsylvanica]|uniref:Protein EARLY FLOWERING 4 domain-containing protein n=1 Tax=Fraxinus pennsylvanica TaxID=56036 RepID=A0AAD1ZAR0_9LAMI|nr:unnamed protein product [Fraxinus pennsylvanica]
MAWLGLGYITATANVNTKIKPPRNSSKTSRRQFAAITQNPPLFTAQISTDFWASVIPISVSIFYRVSWGKNVAEFQEYVVVLVALELGRLLINEINQNHESKIPDNLTRNVSLIRELNNNFRRVVDLYGDLSNSLSKSMEGSSEAESSGTTKSGGLKRIRSSN